MILNSLKLPADIPDPTTSPTPQSLACTIEASWIRMAVDAEGKDSLTDGEKFAICYASGAPIEWVLTGPGTLTARTTFPCDVKKIDGRWHTFINRPPSL